MEIGVKDTGLDQAIRCYRAMAGQDEATRRSLWRAALRYAQKARRGDAGRESKADAPYTTRTGWGSFSAW